MKWGEKTIFNYVEIVTLKLLRFRFLLFIGIMIGSINFTFLNRKYLVLSVFAFSTPKVCRKKRERKRERERGEGERERESRRL